MNVRKYLARIKRRIFKKPFLKNPKNPSYWFNKVFQGQSAFILQIGSNDGKTGDPFYELLHQNKDWNALFVEPIPYLFERLKSNYRNSKRFSFANVAINDGKNLDFYWVDPSAKQKLKDLPFWFDQLGSFDEHHIVSQLGEKMTPFIRSAKLEGRTLSDLTDSFNLEEMDILHIDTEGHDWNILSQLEFEKFQPTFILFESNHLSNHDLNDAYNFLDERYMLFESGIDTLAVNKKEAANHLDAINKHMKQVTGL